MATTLVDNRMPLLDALVEKFSRDPFDNMWYPAGSGGSIGQEALVRVTIANDSYMIERRRTPRASWMPIVTAHISEFDVEAFRTWVERWPLTAQN